MNWPTKSCISPFLQARGAQKDEEPRVADLDRLLEELTSRTARIEPIRKRYRWIHENLLTLLQRELQWIEDEEEKEVYQAVAIDQQLLTLESSLRSNEQDTAEELELLGEREEALELRKLQKIQEAVYFPVFRRAKARHLRRLIALSERRKEMEDSDSGVSTNERTESD